MLLTQLAFVFPASNIPWLRPFLTLEEAEAIEYNGTRVSKSPIPPLWKTAALVLVGLVETTIWTSYGFYVLFLSPGSALPVLANALTWLYAAVRPVVRRRVPTPTYDLLVLYLIRFIALCISSAAMLFNWYVSGDHAPRPKVISLLLDSTGVLLALGIILSFPMGVPSEHVDPKEIGEVSCFCPMCPVSLCPVHQSRRLYYPLGLVHFLMGPPPAQTRKFYTFSRLV